MRRSLQIALILCAVPSAVFAQVDYWSSLLGPKSGELFRLAQLPSGRILLSSYRFVWHSDDLGLTWKQSNEGIHTRTDGFYSNISELFVTSSGVPCVSTEVDLACSSDDGVTWKYVEHTSGNRGASLTEIVETGAGTFVGTSSSKIWRSTDQGASWESVDASDGAGALYYDGSTIWATGRTAHRLRKSTDDGLTWEVVLQSGGKSNLFYVFPSGRLLRATSQLLMSDDGGVTWVGPFSTQEWQTVIRMDSGRVIVFNAGNGSYTDDEGDTWTDFRFDLLPSFNITWDALTPGGDVILAAQNGVGLLRSDDAGVTWHIPPGAPSAAQVLSVVEVAPFRWLVGTPDGIHRFGGQGWSWVEKEAGWTYGFAVRGQEVFAGSEDGLFVSADGGLTFDKRPFNTTVGSRGFLDLFFGPDGALYAINGHDELLRSEDDGNSWTEYPNPGNDLDSKYWQVLDNGTWLVGSANGIWRSEDMGTNWTEVGNVSALNNGNPVPVERFVRRGEGIYYFLSGKTLVWTLDGGANWQLKQLNVKGSLGSLSEVGEFLWIGANGGAIRSGDGFQTFEEVNLGLPAGAFGEMVVRSDVSNYVLLRTSNLGLAWMLRSGVAIESEVPFHSPDLAAAYPNPFFDRVSVDLTLERSGVVRVALFDVLGRRVDGGSELALPAGQHTIPLRAFNVSPGLYLIRVESPSGSMTLPMVKLGR